ncbi:MAG: procyclic acidic repetitive family protein, partial [Treponema sp.]|nr:procyclic acidic repetitive family protein [Treponema sp.]
YEPELETETLYEPEPEIEQPQVEFEPEPQFEIEPVIEPQPETDTWYEPELETEPLYEPEPELVSDFRPVVQEPQPVQEPELPINWDLGSTIFSAGFYWAPLFTIYGNDFADNSTLEGMGLRISLAFYTSRYNMYIGAELTALVSSGDEFFSSIDGYTVSAGANLLALKWMSNQRVALGMRLGASYPLVFGSSYKDNDGFSFNQIIPCVGLSLRWRVTDLFLFETGVDFSNIFGDVLVGYLRPWIGVGIQF